jgi:hypothetical protein
MSVIKDLIATVASLFVDDGNLAIWIALILAVTGFAASTPWLDGRYVGAGFVAAVVAALLVNVRRSAR